MKEAKPLSMRDPISRGVALAALVVAALGFTPAAAATTKPSTPVPPSS